ncbi:MAG TPA: hypothetical protein VK177_04815 [Flavobacteriales bacterium]|nr:hypothetical protein [Flavobacteriales bacterium]
MKFDNYTLFFAVCILFVCSCGTTAKKTTERTVARDTSTPSKGPAPYSPSAKELNTLYAQAIAAYIKQLPSTDRKKMDTLFVGKNPDLPKSLELPLHIEHVPLKLIEDWEHATDKLAYRKLSIYINLIGAFLEQSGDFIFVTFYINNEKKALPQHNFNVHFGRDSIQKQFTLDSTWFDYVYPMRKKQ